MTKKNCIYCDPYDGQAHLAGGLWSVLDSLERFFNKVTAFLIKKFPRSYSIMSTLSLKLFFKVLMSTGILKEVDVRELDEKLHNRSLVIVRAARERGIKVKALRFFDDKPTNFFSAVMNNKKSIFEGLPTSPIDRQLLLDFDDKSALKRILRDNVLPYAEGDVFRTTKEALKYAEKLDFPLVVKPRSGSLSVHTTCNIQSEPALREAIRVAQMVDRDFIVERHILGDVYRVTVVGNEFLACCLREPPNIIGDGVDSIEELVRKKNLHPLRGDVRKKNSTLHKIYLGEKAFSLMATRGMNEKSVPAQGEKIYLHDKVILSCGSDIHDKTDVLNEENKSIFLNLSRLLQTPIVGIDFICKDISKSYREQTCAVIDANSLPYIDMHHFPVTGKPRDVAGYIVDSFLKT